VPYEVIKGLPVISQECLHGRLDDVSGGDIGVIFRTDHLRGRFLVDLNIVVHSGVAKKYVDANLGARRRSANVA
jgi:hypothetical protein